jgi:hypothetical protein
MSGQTDKPKLSADAALRRRITGFSVERIKRMDIQVSVAAHMVAELRRVCVSAQQQNMALMPDGIISWIDECMAKEDVPHAK